MLEVRFIDEVHLSIDTVRAEICIFDDIIIYRIRDAAHIGEVILEIDDGLLYDLLGGFHGARPHTTCKQLVQDQPQDHKQHEGDDGEGHQNRSLDGVRQKASLRLLANLFHRYLLFVIRQARCRHAAVPYTSTAIRRISF